MWCAMAELVESPKSKDKVSWKGRVVRRFRWHGSASTPSDVAAKMTEVTGTFGVPLELCVSSTFSPVCMSVQLCKFKSGHLKIHFGRCCLFAYILVSCMLIDVVTFCAYHPQYSGITVVCYFIFIKNNTTICTSILQCFDAVGWAAGRASGL